jgi:glycosyltransferase involved in cell wall biosynthesis/GT2 family glycosyltransferase
MINPQNPDFTVNPAHPMRKNFEPHLIAWNDSPVLTIVTPFYNTGSVFYETAQSIFNQSLQQWEWLIINDGSTDATAIQILDGYRIRDPRIRVIDHPDNRGLSAARNTGFSHAKCEYVLLLDSDDLLEPTAAEKWWWFLKTHPQYSFVASYHVAFGGMNYLWTGGFHEGAMNAERNRVSMMCVVCKSVHSSVGGFDETMREGLEDWDFWMRCAAHGYWGATIPEYLAWYRVRADHSDRWENLQETQLNEFRTLLQNKYPNLYHGGFPNPIETVDIDLTTLNLEVPTVNHLEKTKPHLLIILPWLVMGGAERFTLNLLDKMNKQDWIISIVTTASSENPWLYEFEKRTPSVFILPNIIPIKDYPRFLSYLIQSRNFDAVFIQGSYEGYRLLPILRTWFPKMPILDYLHFVTPDWMQGGFPKLSLLYKDFIDFTFTSCEQVRNWMIEGGENTKQLEVCYIGVDPQIWKPDLQLREQVRAELGIELNETIILYAARLEEQKQPEVFAETIFNLAQKGAGFHALVAGEGALQAELEEKLHSYKLQERVHMLGSVAAEKMPAIIAASDIFFLPSQNEGISQALYEAMACGLVVVSAEVGGQGELVTTDCGVLRSPESQQNESTEYADILFELICDSPRRQQMSQASRARIIEKFSLDLMGECIAKNLDKLIQNKKNRLQKPVIELEKGTFNREIQNLVEILQARQEVRRLNNDIRELSQKYSDSREENQKQTTLITKLQAQILDMLQPRPPSYWFYLWIRQLFLPVYTKASQTKLMGLIDNIRRIIKKRLVGSS